LHPTLTGHALDAGSYLRFRRMRLRKSARVVLEDANGVPLVIVGTYGKGNVVFCNGRPEMWTPAADRRTRVRIAGGSSVQWQHGTFRVE